MAAKLIRWLIFGVAISLIPLAYNFLNLQLRGASPTLIQLVKNGELLLIICAFCAASIGALVGSGPRMLPLKLICGGGALIILMLSALYFSDVSALAAGIMENELDAQASGSQIVFHNSFWFFTSGVLASGSCVLLSEV